MVWPVPGPLTSSRSNYVGAQQDSIARVPDVLVHRSCPMCNIPAESTHLDRAGRRSGCGRALTLWRSALARALDRRAKLLRIGVAARRDDVLHRGFQVAPDGFAYREFTF